MSLQEIDWVLHFQLVSGEIKNFDPKKGGCICTKDGSEFLFLKSQCVEPRCVPSECEIILEPAPQWVEVGAKVLFSVRRGRIERWCYTGAFNAANKAFKKLPLYRVTQKVTHQCQPVADPVSRSWVTPVRVIEEPIAVTRNLVRLAVALQNRQRVASPYVEIIFEVLQDGNWVRCENPLSAPTRQTA